MDMTKPHALGAYWGTDDRSPHESAVALAEFLARMAEVHVLLSNWYLKGNSRKAALATPLDFADLTEVERSLRPNRRDTDGSTIEELGRSAGLWNGQDEPDAASLSVTSGMRPPVAGLCNHLSLDLPPAIVESTSTTRALLGVVIDVWRPAWAAVYSLDALSGKTFGLDTPLVDWMLFLGNIDIDQSRLPQPAIVEHIDGAGSLIQTQDAPLDYDDRLQQQRIGEIRRALSAYSPVA